VSSWAGSSFEFTDAGADSGEVSGGLGECELAIVAEGPEVFGSFNGAGVHE
jgi:hypothetical protein